MNPRQLRHDWTVRWAHHPLCARHASETWRIGRLHLCRGCVSLGLGVLVSMLGIAALGSPPPAWLLAALAPSVIALSWPPLYQRLPRLARDALRAGAGAIIVLSITATWQSPRLAWPILPILFVVWRGFVRARTRVAARSCDGCPELGKRGVCSGYALQVACMRAFEREVEAELGEALSGEGPLPPRIAPRA